MKFFSRDYWVTILAPRGRRRAARLSRGGRDPWVVIYTKIALFLIVAWICVWWQAVIGETQKAPEKWALDSFTITIKKDERVTLGWRDLGQKPGGSSAEERHIVLQERNGRLWLYNVAHVRRVGMTLRKPVSKGEEAVPAFETLSERLVIPKGAVSQVAVNGGKGKLTFSNVTDRTFDLEVESITDRMKRKYHYNGGPNGLERSDSAPWSDGCARPDLFDRLLNDSRLAALSLLEQAEAYMPPAAARLTRRASESDIAVLGGEHDCVEPSRKQIGRIGQLAWRSLKIVRNGSVFMIAPYDAATRGRQLVSLSVSQSARIENPRSFQEAGWQVDGAGSLGRLTSIVVGKTSYATAFDRRADSIRVTFTPSENVMLFAAGECDTPDDRKSCPSQLDTGALSLKPGARSQQQLCSPDRSRCWTWSRQSNPLSILQEKIAEKTETVAWRGIAAVAALLIAGILAGGPAIALQRLYPPLRKRAALVPYRTLRPLLLTSLSVALALAPNLLDRWGIVVQPLLALQITLLNWLFAAAVLLWGVSGILLGFLWIAVTLMAALGSMNLAVMVVDGDTSRWISFFVKHRIMFIDFVPPLVIAVASCPTTALRPVLQGFVAGSSGWSRLVRFVPAVMLVLLFGAWFFVGRQTGFGVFQPVEAGKFAMVFLVTTALMSLDPRLRTGSSRAMALLSSVLALCLVALLTALLVSVPLLRSDWSPALIMVLLFAGVLVAFGAVLTLRSMGDQLDAHYQRQQVPRVFKPAFSVFWWVKRTWFYAVLAMFIAGTGIWFVVGSPISGTFARVTGVQTWKGDVQGKLLDLENEGLGTSRRVVVERIISWLDLDFDRPEVASCAFSDKPSENSHDEPRAQRACYLDIEWQLIRSRRVIAAAPCGFADYLRAGPGFSATAADDGYAAAGILRPFAALLGERSICNVERPSNSENPQGKRKEVRPIDIPVVESDFAGSFLIGRLGAAAGLLLYGAQALLLTVVAIGFVRVSWMPSGGQVDEAVRRYIAIVLGGTGWLLLLQWSLSWSNMLGLLPVMGQPMTWLSYATSHHLFMAVPCVLVFVVGLRYAGMPSYRYTPRDPPRTRYNRWSLW